MLTRAREATRLWNPTSSLWMRLSKRQVHDVVKQERTGKVTVKLGPGGRSSVSGQIATVFGCTGFLGRYVVNHLARQGTQVVTPYRGTDDDRRHLKLMGDLGQIVQTRFDIRNDTQIMEAMRHSDVVYNLIGKDYETKNFTFDQVHVEGARRLAKLAREAGVNTFVHVSALNANENSSSLFLRSKALGEKAVLEEFPEAVIVRPGYMYGYEDRFWNRMGWFVKWSPFGFPVYNQGKTKMRPVYVGDVAAALTQLASNPMGRQRLVELYGQVFLLCKDLYSSPHEYHLGSLIEFFSDVARRKPLYTFFPKPINKLMGAIMNRLTFSPFITEDEVERYYIHDTPTPNSLTFKDLQLAPLTVEETISRFVKLHQPEEFQNAPVEPIIRKYTTDHLQY